MYRHIQWLVMVLSLLPTPAATPSAGASGTGAWWTNVTIIAALIGLGGVVLGVTIAIWTTLYQTRRSERLQHTLTLQNEQLQRDLALQNEKFQRESASQNEQLQRDLMQAQKALEIQSLVQERQEKHEQEIDAAEHKKQQMLRATSDTERVQIYRDALQHNPRLCTIKILNMQHPLETLNVYVRLRLHQDTQLSYRPDFLSDQDAPLRDPNVAFQTDWQRREQRQATAMDPENAVRSYPRCVILGDPGAGKTTLLRYLALMTAKRALPALVDLLPIYIELSTFVTSKFTDLLEYAAQTWSDLCAFPVDEARRVIGDALYEGKALLLLDALDETVVGETKEIAEHSYSLVSQAIDTVVKGYPRASLVVTARKADYQQRASLTGFTELELLDFRPEDIQQFIVNWYRYSGDSHKDQKSEDLTRSVERNPRIHALAANPLLLSLIVLVYEARLDLPERRADLYKRCVETLLMEWDARRNIRRLKEFQPEHKQQLLEAVAWHFHLQGKRYFPERELLALIADFLPMVGLAKHQSRSILLEITSEHGLLKEQAQGWYGFVHLTLQEYFVAEAIIDQDHLEQLLRQRANAWWEEVFLLYAGSAPDVSPLLRRLVGKDPDHPLREDIFATNLLLAGRCLSSRPTVREVSLRTVVIDHLFALLQSTPYTLLQRQIAEVLAMMGSAPSGTRLLRLLGDASVPEGLQVRIAEALGRLGERSIAGELLRLLADASVPDYVRWSIAYALGSLGERSVAGEMLRLLVDASVPDGLRWRIAYALGSLGERSIAGELLRLLEDASVSEDVRGSIADALGSLGERSIAGELLRLLEDASVSEDVRGSIVDALGSLGERSIAGELLRLLADASVPDYVRGSIAEALGSLGERSIAGELLRLLADASVSAYLRWRIAEALGRLGERSIAGELLRLLADASVPDSLRGSIALALETLVSDPMSIQQLARLLAYSNLANIVYTLLWKVSRQAAVSIFPLGDPFHENVEVVPWEDGDRPK